MRYMGSKRRVVKEILPIMVDRANAHGISDWVEPFVGGANVIIEVPSCFDKFGFDNNKYLIQMYKDIQNGCRFNDDIIKEDYDLARNQYRSGIGNKTDGEIGWIGFMGSANGRFYDGGFSGKSVTKSGLVRDYIDENVRGFSKEFDKLIGISFNYSSFEDVKVTNSIIYCDPPYVNTKKYDTSKSFSYDDYYDWCFEMSKDNLVFCSEYVMPKLFSEVWCKSVNSSISANSVSGGSKSSIERLFTIK